MSGTLGRVEEFDGNRNDWPEYVERVEHFFLANGIDSAEKKRAVFLSVIGPSTYKTLRNLVSPREAGRQVVRGPGSGLVEALQASALGDSGEIQVPQPQQTAG